MCVKSIRKIVKKILQYPILKLFPEITVLLNKDSREFICDRGWNNCISHNTKIYTPSRIYETIIGEYTYIAQNSYISCCDIGKFCSIGPNFICGWGIHPLDGISTSPMFFSTRKQNGITLSNEDKIEERKHIKIGNDVFIGANVTILDGVTIGDGAVIGAGAVVSKNIPPYAVAIGCPIRITRYRFNDFQIKGLQNIKWWDFGDDKLKDVEKLFFDVEQFIKKYS